MASHILLYFFVIVTLVFIASAEGEGSFKLLEYGEELPAYPWQKFEQRARTPRMQRRQFPDLAMDNKHQNNFLKASGLKVIYSRMPMPVIEVSSYPKPKRH